MTTEISSRPVPRPAMPERPNRHNHVVCERGDSNPQAFRRQILRLSPVAWLHIEWRSVALFRWVFGEASRGVARSGLRRVPLHVPPSLIALALLLATATGCEAHATLGNGDTGRAPIGELVVSEDTARGVVCYASNAGPGSPLSCVKVRPDSGRVR